MYYGGDVAELLLALALVSTWKTRPAIDPSPIHHVGPDASLASATIRGRPKRQPDSALGPGIGWPGPATPSASAPGPAGRSSVSPK